MEHDLMYYLGEIAVCNLYDKDNQYFIHQSVIDKYPNIVELSEMATKCLTFDQFAQNIDAFHNLILKQRS